MCELIGVVAVPLRRQAERAIADALEVEQGLPGTGPVGRIAGMDDVVPGEPGLALPSWLW